MDSAHEFDLYQLRVEEYRFQVQLNWQRTQYLLGLNALILAFGTGLHDTRFSILVYVAGFGLAVAAAWWDRIQHRYYRVARDQMLATAEHLVIPDGGVGGTDTAQHRPGRRVKVRDLVQTLFVLFAILDAAGVVLHLVHVPVP
jgi:hypothetical protein